MKIYIAGKITGLDDYKIKFKEAENRLLKQEYAVLNPCVLPAGFDQEEYLHICFAMIDICESVYFLENWISSPGARKEYERAKLMKKTLFFENYEHEMLYGK